MTECRNCDFNMIKMIYMIGCGIGCLNHDFYRIFGINKIMFVGAISRLSNIPLLWRGVPQGRGGLASAISRLSNTFVGVGALRATPKHQRNQHVANIHKNQINHPEITVQTIKINGRRRKSETE
jgi:hypothetical protein